MRSKIDERGISISNQINNMREVLSNAPEASRMFEEKLVSLGFIDKKIYNDIYFTLNGIAYYNVNEKFPRLVTENVPSEIVGVKYDLSLVGIEPWKIKEADIWN